MTILNKIDQAIWNLVGINVDRKDMIIAYSPLIERYIFDEVMKSVFFNLNKGELLKYQGITIYNLHPYNEIVVYDSVNACYYPELIKKIESPLANKTIL